MEMAKIKPKKKEESKPAVPKFVPLKPDPEAYANFGKTPQAETDDQKRMRAEIIAKMNARGQNQPTAQKRPNHPPLCLYSPAQFHSHRMAA